MFTDYSIVKAQVQLSTALRLTLAPDTVVRRVRLLHYWWMFSPTSATILVVSAGEDTTDRKKDTALFYQ